MSQNIKIEFTPEAKAAIRDLGSFPERCITAIKKAMDEQNTLTIGHIQAARLSHRGPESLGVISNRLRQSVRATPAFVVSGAGALHIESAIGTNVEYAAIHEFGGVIKRVVKPGTARLRVNARGELLRQPGRAGAIFAKGTHKRVREVPYAGGKSYEIHMPERAPFRRGIADRIADYARALSEAIVAAWKNKG